MPRKQRFALPLLQKRWLSVLRRKAFILRRLSRRRRLGRSCLVSARNLRSSSHFSGRYRSWRRLSCPEPRPGSRRGPLFLGGPLRALCACASTPWGPGAPLACATHVGHGRVPLTSVARLFRAFLRAFSVPDFAPPLLLHPSCVGPAERPSAAMLFDKKSKREMPDLRSDIYCFNRLR